MVDRITPRTEKTDIAALAEDFGIEDEWPVVTEPFMQWVVEDKVGKITDQLTMAQAKVR